MNVTRSTWWRGLLRFLFPAPCLACGAVQEEDPGPLGLCEGCGAGVEFSCPQGAVPCLTCGVPLAAASPPPGYQCGACRGAPPPFSRLVTVWRYEAPLSEVLLAFKLRRLEYLGDALAAAALEALHRRGLLDALAGLDRVVPVPLHWSRRWTRGFNQSEVLARWVAKGLGLPWCDALQRRRGGTAQRLLGRGRRLEAARGAFAIRARERVRDLRVLLVDDVVTTGATLGSAATALRAAGAREVVALAFARTPRPGRESGPVVRTLQG